MQFSISFAVIVIFGYVGQSWAMSMAEPISFVLQIKYNLPLRNWELKCEGFKDITKLKSQAANFTLTVLPQSLSEKLPNSSSMDGLDDIIKNDCLENGDLKEISRNVVSDVQKCLDEGKKLDAAKEKEIEKELVKAMCGNVRSSIEWQIMSLTFSQSN